MPARYAVYYAPSAGDALHQAVTPLLGRDALGGLNVPQATPPGVDPVFWKAVTRVPAHYGLHATLKAPFELRHSGMDSQLLRSTGEVASRFLPFVIPSLSLAYLGKEEKGFYALVPSTKCSLLSFLERACVMDLDAFRAPLKTEDVARRGHLSLEERSNLYMWGYHRVLDSFQFHITLTDGIADAGIACACGRGPAQGAGRRAGRSAPYRCPDPFQTGKPQPALFRRGAASRSPTYRLHRKQHDVSHRSTRKDAAVGPRIRGASRSGALRHYAAGLRGSPRAGNRAGHDPGPRGQHRRRPSIWAKRLRRAAWSR